MKPFALLIVGVVVGWAASGVDWGRDAVGQTARFVPLDAKPDPPATLQAEISDAPQQPTSQAVPAEPGPGAAPRKADGVFVDAPVADSVQPPTPLTATTQANLADAQPANVPANGPRGVFEAHVIPDANGNLRKVIVSRLANGDVSVVRDTPVAQQSPYSPPTDVQINATAVAHPPVAGLVGRFQASAYGSPSGHGCYVVDTMTGKTWHVANGQPARVVAEGFVPQATPKQSTWLPPDHQSPLGSVVVPTPSNVVLPVPQNKSVVEPTPKQNSEPSDAD